MSVDVNKEGIGAFWDAHADDGLITRVFQRESPDRSEAFRFYIPAGHTFPITALP